MSAVDTINALLEDTRSDVTVIVSILETLKAEGGNEFVKGAEKCGDACRQRELPPPAFLIFTGEDILRGWGANGDDGAAEWRQILGDGGILEFFLDQLDQEVNPLLGRQVFRVIANSIADNGMDVGAPSATIYV